jgi:hypothetical protein
MGLELCNDVKYGRLLWTVDGRCTEKRYYAVAVFYSRDSGELSPRQYVGMFSGALPKITVNFRSHLQVDTRIITNPFSKL